MALTVTLEKAEQLLIDTVNVGLVPMLTSSPGMGKSAIIRKIAKKYALELIDIRLAQCDPVDLAGFPQIINGKASYVPFDTFPTEKDALPKGKKGWLLFMDEMNSALPAVQSAAYKIVLDRMVGQFKLHPKVATVCAGNLSTDRAVTNNLSTAMQSRLVHLELTKDHKGWLTYAAKAGIDHRIQAYINWKPSNLNNFSSDHKDKTFACERTWEFVSKLISKWPTDISSEKVALLVGTVGEGVGREFYGFTKIYLDLPTLAELVAAPEKVPVPVEPNKCFAMASFIGEHMDDKNAKPLMKYLARLKIEFQVMSIRSAIANDMSLHNTDEVQDWLTKNATSMM